MMSIPGKDNQKWNKQKWNTGICSSLYNFELYEPNEASKIHNCVTIKLWRWNERERVDEKRMTDSKNEKMRKQPSNSFQLTPAGWSYQWWPCYSCHITHICIHPKYSTYMHKLHNIKMHKAKTISFLNVHSVRALKNIMINHQNISLSQTTNVLN